LIQLVQAVIQGFKQKFGDIVGLFNKLAGFFLGLINILLFNKPHDQTGYQKHDERSGDKKQEQAAEDKGISFYILNQLGHKQHKSPQTATEQSPVFWLPVQLKSMK
jgi:hypothetical protein